MADNPTRSGSVRSRSAYQFPGTGQPGAQVTMDIFEVLASPARRLVLEALAGGERSAGELTDAVIAAHGLTQPAVSRHLAVLRESRVVSVRAEGTRRIYALVPDALQETHAWLSRYERFWAQRLDALDTELARGRRTGRPAGSAGLDGPASLAEQPAAVSSRGRSGGRQAG